MIVINKIHWEEPGTEKDWLDECPENNNWGYIVL